MKKPTDLELLDHFLGRGDPALRRRIDQSLDSSTDLRRRYDELVSLWMLLGEVDADIPHRDLWPGVAERLAGRVSRPIGRDGSVSKSWWAAASAAVIAAALVGYGSGQLRLHQQTAAPTVAINESEIITQLQLTVFGSSSVQQFGQSLLQDDTQGST